MHPADADLFGSTGEMTTAAAYYTIDMNKESQKYLDKVKLKANEKNIQIKTESYPLSVVSLYRISYSFFVRDELSSY